MMETMRTMTAPIARSVTMPAWVESGLAQGAEAMRRLRDGLPPEVRRVTDQIPGEVLVCACVLLVLFNVVVLLTNVKARPDATRDAMRCDVCPSVRMPRTAAAFVHHRTPRDRSSRPFAPLVPFRSTKDMK